ncbi:hypothetical protein BY458DRAFT_512367 [Sporodiniella umbellata]|nr:hypothetical protein BY458DRAFT_512367 [Sporodiniella umbellata]
MDRVLKKKPVTISIDSDEDEPPAHLSLSEGSSTPENLFLPEPVQSPELLTSQTIKTDNDPTNAELIRQQLEMDETYAQMIAADLEGDSEYEIEKIVSHTIFKGKVVQYEIKWKGYEESDNTLEMANSIHSDVPDLCESYWDHRDIQRPSNAPGYGKQQAVGKERTPKKVAKPIPVKSSVKASVKTAVKAPVKTAVKASVKAAVKTPVKAPVKAPIKAAVKTTTPQGLAINLVEPSIPTLPDPNLDTVSMMDIPRCLADKGYALPTSYPKKHTSWSDEVSSIGSIQKSPIDNTLILVYLDWKNGEKTVHTLQEIHHKCPLKLIDYYEARLKFV